MVDGGESEREREKEGWFGEWVRESRGEEEGWFGGKEERDGFGG